VGEDRKARKTAMIVISLGIIAMMLLLNGVLAAYEMALASISRARLHVLESRRIKGAAESAFMKDHIEGSLAVVQLGITLVGAISAATGGLSAADLLSPYLINQWGFSHALSNVISVIVIVIPLSSFTIIFAELVPKMIALNDRERVCLTLSPYMKKLFKTFTPVVGLFENAVKWIISKMFKAPVMGEENAHLHELQAAAALARTSRLIGAREEKIVVAAAQLSTRRVKEIFIPTADICTIALSATLSEALIRAHMDMHTRFPVCAVENDRQTIQGYINFKDIMAALKLNPSDPTVKGIVRPIRSVESDVTIAHALETMIQDNLHIMLVIAKDKGVIGMITLEDIIEELVGDIEDEFDRFPSHVHPYSGGWIVGGGVTMGVLARETGVALRADVLPNMRFADWCTRHKQGDFEGGETIEADGLVVLIRKLRRRKVGEAAVSLK
jgi:putative hemolysin